MKGECIISLTSCHEPCTDCSIGHFEGKLDIHQHSSMGKALIYSFEMHGCLFVVY